MSFDELLAHYKAQARTEDALVPILDPSLLLYLAVWPRVSVQRLGEPGADSWEALWDCVLVDVAGLALAADVTHPRATYIWRRLVAMHLIYPDGTVPDMVRNVVGKRVTDALKK